MWCFKKIFNKFVLINPKTLNIMKKITSIIRASIVAVAAMLTLVSFNSCQEIASSAIDEAVKEANKECPFEVDGGFICDRVYTSGNSVVYSCLVEDPNMIDGINMLGNTAADYIFTDIVSMARMDKDLKTLIELCVEAEYDITYKYSDYSGRSASVTITHSKLSTI